MAMMTPSNVSVDRLPSAPIVTLHWPPSARLTPATGELSRIDSGGNFAASAATRLLMPSLGVVNRLNRAPLEDLSDLSLAKSRALAPRINPPYLRSIATNCGMVASMLNFSGSAV